MKAFRTIFKIEFRLSLRDMNLLIFGVLMPLVFAVILGLLVKDKPAFEGAAYTFYAQSFGAMASIGICATGLMGIPLVLSDYRHRKILKRFRATPVSPGLLLFVQFMTNMVYSVISLVLVWAVSALFFGYRMQGSVLWFLLAFFLVMCAIYALGLLVASVSPNIKTANLLCTLLYFPMLLFSGATLPYEVMPRIMQRITDILPLTQGIKLLKAASLGLPVDNIAAPLLVLFAFFAVCTGISIRFFRWE